MRQITVDQFRAELVAQGVSSHEHFAFRCPMCGTIQSGQDLIKAGAGKTFAEVERYIAFSCVGRWTGAGAPRKKPDGKPCDWTLGGLFALHKLEVVTPEGQTCPRFEPATPEEAQAHEKGQMP
ncbi:VVA0879 family protein [uncultured Alsobacter sp.]|uniref:VVA0879 family protein n=1 Tax=uncultured Alsobacter sp. TaxID=1748258 RepID=UPI0025D84046|nr:VVA0879 family protein [uncultured Alsobacter sp.]